MDSWQVDEGLPAQEGIPQLMVQFVKAWQRKYPWRRCKNSWWKVQPLDVREEQAACRKLARTRTELCECPAGLESGECSPTSGKSFRSLRQKLTIALASQVRYKPKVGFAPRPERVIGLSVKG